MATILVIDPSPAVRETLRIVLGDEHVVAVAASWDEVASRAPPDLVIYGAPLFPRDDARASEARARVAPDAPLLLLNPRHEVDADAIAGPGGRIAFLPKPFDLHALRRRVQALLASAAPPAPSETTVERHRRWLEHPFVATSAAELARRATLADLPVLLVGEAGTGAVELASAIHFFGGGHGPIPVRSARDLDVATLARRRGGPSAVVIENVHELSRDAQHALLESLRDTRPERVRMFATTNADLESRVAAGTVVPELAYALTPFTIALTPLRERPADVPALARKLTTDLITRLRLEPVTYTEAALARLQQYLWFGNVAELEAVLARTLAVRRPRVVEPDALLFTEVQTTRALVSPTAPEAVTPAARGARVVPLERVERRRSDGADRAPAESEGTGGVLERPTNVQPADVHSRATPADRRSTGGDDPSLEVLLGELAHELRNPMVTIKTFAQHLDSVLADPEVARAVRRAHRRGDHAHGCAARDAPRLRPLPGARSVGRSISRALLDRALAERADELARKSVRVDAPQNGSGAVLVEADESAGAVRAPQPARGARSRPRRARAGACRGDRRGCARDRGARRPRRRGTARRLCRPAARTAARLAHPPLAFALATALIRRNGGALEVRSAADGAMIITVSLPRSAR